MKRKTVREDIDIQIIRDWFKDSADVVFKTKLLDSKWNRIEIHFLYSPNLVDMNPINELILPNIFEAISNDGKVIPERLSHIIEINRPKDKEKLKNEIETNLFSGNVVFISADEVFFIPIAKPPKRTPEESSLESSIRGPKDGFIENISDNMALIRQRLKSSALKSKEYTLGERSKTKVILLYMDDILNSSILNDIQSRLDSFQIDILASNYQLEEYLYDNRYSIMPLLDYVGRPDFVVQALNQGRFAILVDGNPTCMIGPTSLNQILFSPEDSHTSFLYTSFVRCLRIAALFATIFLPGFYIALLTFQLDQIPYTLLATLSVSRLGLPLPAALEAIIMLTMFELFKEAGLRLPKAVGQTVAVLGGLIIGDAAIRSGLTSPAMLVVISVTVLSGYTLVNQNLAGNIAIIRYIVLILSSIFGLFGFFISLFTILTLIAAMESFGQPYLVALARPNPFDLIGSIIRIPSTLSKQRNQGYLPKDKDRKGSQ